MSNEQKKKERGLLGWLRGRNGPATPVATSPTPPGHALRTVPGAPLEADDSPLVLPELGPEPAASSVRGEPALPSTELLQRFVDLGEIGRGGMASIRRVRDTNLLRDVAMKVLDPELAKAPTFVQGFLDEARIGGQLEHPNIAPVHELGRDAEGLSYFTMKLVRGRTFYDWMYDPARPPGSPERLSEGLDILAKVCDAVSYAHSRGVIHRDLKPDNVMVDRFGQVYLMDWGLAQVGGEGASAEGAVQVPWEPDSPLANARWGAVGTPAYMSPEQALGSEGRMDERTDVFGLGAILYQLGTGLVPYEGDDVKDVIERVKRGAHPPPEEAVSFPVPPGLCRIIRKAMARDPADRHASADELKQELRRFTQGGLHLPRVTFPALTWIVTEGDPGDAAYIITRGRCAVYQTVEGQRRLLRHLGPGEVFGETAVFSSLPRTATVEALEPVTAMVVTRAVLEEGLGLDGWLGLFVRSLAHRFRELELLHQRP